MILKPRTPWVGTLAHDMPQIHRYITEFELTGSFPLPAPSRFLGVFLADKVSPSCLSSASSPSCPDGSSFRRLFGESFPLTPPVCRGRLSDVACPSPGSACSGLPGGCEDFEPFPEPPEGPALPEFLAAFSPPLFLVLGLGRLALGGMMVNFKEREMVG